MVCRHYGCNGLLWMVAAMGVMPFHQRLAQLWQKNKATSLTPEEIMELDHCMTLHVKYCWEMAYLENMSLLASMTRDVDWQHEICLDIEEVQRTGKRKPGPRKDAGKKKE